MLTLSNVILRHDTNQFVYNSHGPVLLIFSNLPIFRLRERELQLQSDLTTASREINRLRMNIKQAASGHTQRSSDHPRSNDGGHPGLTSASLASLSLRSPPSDSDRQH